jgi:hypothetical protein
MLWRLLLPFRFSPARLRLSADVPKGGNHAEIPCPDGIAQGAALNPAVALDLMFSGLVAMVAFLAARDYNERCEREGRKLE